jgi:hypothetical protein
MKNMTTCRLKYLLQSSIITCSLLLTSCAATDVAISKHNLDVQTKNSSSIFLDPISHSQKTIYVQINNTSDKSNFSVKPSVISLLKTKGYTVTSNPSTAHYLLQANILQVAKSDPSSNKQSLAGGYGGAIAGAAVTSLASSSTQNIVAGGLVGGLISQVTNSAVKDVTFAVVTDVQISERTTSDIKSHRYATLSQGLNSTTTESSNSTSHLKRYRTRIISSAEKVNLKFENALPALEEGLSHALAGMF